MDLSAILYFLCLISTASIRINADEFNVLDFGAAGDGNADDSMAFIKAWNNTCSATAKSPTMVIPKGKTFLVRPITFAGPCKSSDITIMLSGSIIAPNGPNEWKEDDKSKWFEIQGVDSLQIDGSGTIDGRGKAWWDISCKINKKEGCIKLAPTVLKFDRCNNLRMNNMNFINSPQTHVTLMGCNGVEFGFLSIQAPGTSPNTDGIHIQASSNVYIHNAHISDGDDCISIGDNTSNINITQVDCGPGHGVSIGSLGKDGGEVGKGTVKHIVFSNLNFTDVENPIIIDQHYCDVADSCKETDTGVHIDDVLYAQSFGTSKTEVAINLNCSSSSPCTNIIVDTIQLKPANPGQRVISSCNNANGQSKGTDQPKCCF
ncbi:polygalacturonase ADPG1 [Citrus sinensis]|uniref:Polygalacturonase ADPG1 n=1 Tax=Citrus sinensis TaxID=2711 RepID=A0ACB8JBQ7_CITSI|nr:polygalacturonase ADPG1 [Citrus sinensis]